MLRFVAAVAVLAFGVSIIAISETDAIRFGSGAEGRDCLETQFLNLPSEPDIVLLGSSRVRRGVGPEALSSALAREPAVYNLGRPENSVARSYHLLRELYDRGVHPSLAIVEISIDPLRGAGMDDWKLKRGPALVFSYGDLLDIPIEAADAGALGYFALTSEGFLKKIESAIFRTLTERGGAWRVDEGAAADSVCMLPRFDNPTNRARKANKAKQRKWGRLMKRRFGKLSVAFDDQFAPVHNSYVAAQMHYISRIRNLAEAQGSTLIFVRPSRVYSPPYSDRVRAELQQLFPEFRVPPEDVWRKLSRSRHYMDIVHLSPSGRAIYTNWLAGVAAEAMGGT